MRRRHDPPSPSHSPPFLSRKWSQLRAAILMAPLGLLGLRAVLFEWAVQRAAGPAVVAAAMFSMRAKAVEAIAGTVTATTTAKSNLDTAVPFTISANQRYAIQCDAAGYLRWSVAGTAATSATGVSVGAGDLYVTSSGTTFIALSAVAVTGTINCRVFAVYQ